LGIVFQIFTQPCVILQVFTEKIPRAKNESDTVGWKCSLRLKMAWQSALRAE
jgi:hypothetical protein